MGGVDTLSEFAAHRKNESTAAHRKNESIGIDLRERKYCLLLGGFNLSHKKLQKVAAATSDPIPE